MSVKEYYGFIRSWLMYYAKPFNQKKLQSFYTSLVKQDDLVFDIGAHLGNRTCAFLALRANVIAIEPQPTCYKFLEKKFRANQHFTLINAIVGKDIKDIDFYINTLAPTISTARADNWMEKIHEYSTVKTAWDHKIKVPCVTIDYLINTYGLPAFCKIDTEGFEWEVLQGLSRAIRSLSIEYLDFEKENSLKCVDKMKSLGEYECNFSPAESQTWMYSSFISLDQFRKDLASPDFKYHFGDIYFRLKSTG